MDIIFKINKISGIIPQIRKYSNLWNYGLGRSTFSSPLTEPYPGVPSSMLKDGRDLPTPKTQITNLKNGLRVASEETYAQISSVAVFVDVGSRDEPKELNGICHLLQRMGFKSTKNRTHKQIANELEKTGAIGSTSSSREHMVYSIDVPRYHLRRALDLLSDGIKNTLFLEEELDQQKTILESELQELQNNHDAVVHELMHLTAFSNGQGLGLPMYCPPENLPHLTPQLLNKFSNDNFTGGNIVLAGVGVEHHLLVEYADKLFSDIPKTITKKSRDLSQYTGGMRYVERDGVEYTHIMIGFKSPSFQGDSLFQLGVLQILLGGGDSFSAGGPGKGMYSRLYTNVLTQSWVNSAVAIYSPYSDVGIFAVHASCDPTASSKLVKLLRNELFDVMKSVPQNALQRAKNQLKSALMMNLESRSVVLEDVGKNILVFGKKELRHRKYVIKLI